ncbi:Iron-sulfur cluster assembly enzyme ISCU, partial [Blattella germanica]
VLDHYENPRNVGSLDKNDTQVGTGLVGAPACGDVMKLQIKVDEASKLKNTDIAKELCLPPVKLHCSMLAEDAIKAALSDYKVKQESMNKENDKA